MALDRDQKAWRKPGQLMIATILTVDPALPFHMKRPDQLPPLSVGLLLALAGVKLLVHLVFGGSYGFHRDELYYLVCGRHLEWGFVDHPPLVPLLARVVEELAGPSLRALRLVAGLGGAAVVFLAGVLARELGGRAFAQGLAAAAVLASPILLMTNNLFQTVTFDQLTWVSATLLLLVLLRTGDRRLWLAVGGVAGIGLLAKYTILLFGVGLVGALLLTRHRRELISPWIWAGGVLAFLVALPNLLWQIERGWPTVEFIRNLALREGASTPPAAFLGAQTIFIGGITLPLFGAGLAFLFGRRGEPFRILGWLVLLVTGLLLATGGKPYYLAPLYPMVLAAGAVWTDALATRRGWRRLRTAVPAIVLLGNLPVLWIFLPVLPRASFAAHQGIFPHQELHETFGWEELARQVAAVYDSLPKEERQRAGLLTSSYGEAAALDLFGPQHGLPRAASGHNSYYHWGPPAADVVVAVFWSPERLARVFGEVEEVQRVSNSLGIRNQASQQTIYLCRKPKGDWSELWPLLRTVG